MRQVTFPVRVMRELGCDTLIVMNAVGSMNPLIHAGSLVLVDDHINFMGDNPLIGPNDEALGPRFPDMSMPYCPACGAWPATSPWSIASTFTRASWSPWPAQPGDPRRIPHVPDPGADIVSMSTVPEVIVGNHAGMKVMAISTVTDNCCPTRSARQHPRNHRRGPGRRTPAGSAGDRGAGEDGGVSIVYLTLIRLGFSSCVLNGIKKRQGRNQLKHGCII